MKKKLLILMIFTTLIAAKIIIGNPIKQFKIKDQFGIVHKITPNTKKIFFAFKKASGHYIKNYLKSKKSNFLESKDMLFVADVTAIPSIVKFFVLPFSGYEFAILTLDNKALSKEYLNDEFIDKTMVVSLKNFIVTDISYIDKVNNHTFE